MKNHTLALAAASILIIPSCTPQQQQWGLGGAAAGGAAGAVLGDDSGDIIRGAALGAAAGAGTAAYREHQQNTRPPSPYFGQPDRNIQAPPPVDNSNYPTATRTSDPNVVISPHRPYNKVKVTGLQPGQKARDPFTNEVFLVP